MKSYVKCRSRHLCAILCVLILLGQSNSCGGEVSSFDHAAVHVAKAAEPVSGQRMRQAAQRCNGNTGIRAESRRIVSKYKAVFDSPPTKTPSDTAVDGPLLGNGDLGVTISGPPQSQRLWISKNDFWRLKSQYGGSGPRVFGWIDVAFPDIKGAEYRIEQDIYTAITSARFTREDTTVSMSGFVSATDNYLIVELSSAGEPVDVEVNLTVAQGNGSETKSGQEDAVHWVTRQFSECVDIPVAAACAMTILGADGLKFQLQPGFNVTMVAAVVSSFDSPTFAADVRKKVARCDPAQLRQLSHAHAAWWRDFWSRSFVEIGDPLIDQRYYLSNYVMASCSGNPDFPPPIFGTWITTDSPGWFGDYHLNYNHMAPYYGLYSSNHIKQADSYHAPILAFIDRGKWYAANALNTRGVYYPVGIGPKGIETTRDCARHADWHKEKGGLFFGQKSNASYCVVNIAMRWYHTYDHEYAARLYPFVREVADFWCDYLKFEDGRYVIYDDAIHEGSGDNKDFNPVLSLGLVRMVLELAVDMSTELGVDRQMHPTWKHVLEHLSEFPRQVKDGVEVFRYTEKGTPWWTGNTLGIQHIHPVGAIGLESSEDLLTVSRNTIRVMNRWIDGNGMNSFFPAAVRVGYDPNTILAKLGEMIRKVGQANGFTRRNPHGIENCSIVPNTINEMLCMGHQNVLRVFEIWPKNIDARFTNLRTVGAFLVSSELKQGRVQYIRIKSERGRPCTINNPWPGCTVLLHRDGREVELTQGRRFTLETRPGEDLVLSPRD